MRNHKSVGVAAALTILSIFTFLISGNHDIIPGSVQDQATPQMNIALQEWELIPAAPSNSSGDTVTFNISNTGRFGHALEVSGNGTHGHSATNCGGSTTTMTVSFEFSGDYRIL